MQPDDLEQLKDDLINYRAPLEAPGGREELVESGLPRILATLEMIPDSCRDADILELGSSPYFLSLCLRRLCRGSQRRGNYFGTEHKTGVDRLVHQKTGEEVRFEYDLFNIETDEFPYADGSFDIVIFSELIEHLGLNPVWTLSEIHRVLRPNGLAIVTTPNALSLERLSTFARGGSQMVDRYSPLFGYGARHNREYHPRELRELLEATGYAIEEMSTRDLKALPRSETWQRAVWNTLLSLYSDTPRGEHIFLRARRNDRFRWQFPASLFDNIQFFVLVRHPWVEMGINDVIQCAAGWYPLERRADGRGEMRWAHGVAQAFLKTPGHPSTIKLDVLVADHASSPSMIYVRAHDRWLGKVDPNHVYVDGSAPLRRGTWQTIELPLRRQPNPGDELEVLISTQPIPHDPAEQKQPPVNPAERDRTVAIHKLWMDATDPKAAY
jgi:SAM-dependent methyltransferase